MGLKKGIGSPFRPDGARRSVTGIDPKLVSQGEDLFSDPFYKRFMASAREIRSADRSRKKSVACKYGAGGQQADATRRVSGCVNHRKGVGTHLDLLTFLEAALRRDAQSGSIVRMNENRRFGDPFQLLHASDVIDVAMGDENVPDADPVPGNLFGNTKNLIAGVNDNTLQRVFASQDVAIGLIRADRQLSKHGANLHFL
jgi:hypothetical protein